MILYPSYIPLFNSYSVHNVMSVLFCHACTTFSHDYSYSTWRYLYGSFNLVTFRCLCCSFCACCAFTTMAMITWPLYLKMLALFFSELDEILSACCRSWDESLNLMTWCGMMKADNWRNRAAEAASCLISRNRIWPFKFQQFFIQHNKNIFFGFCVPINSTTTSEAPGSVLLDLGMVL